MEKRLLSVTFSQNLGAQVEAWSLLKALGQEW